MKKLPVDFRLADNGKTDGSQNVCAPDKLSGEQANSALPEPALRIAPARPLW